MIKLSDCDVAEILIPNDPTVSKSKKLLKIHGIWFFIQSTKDFTKIYEVSTKRLILCPGEKAKGLDYLVEHIGEIKIALDDFKKGDIVIREKTDEYLEALRAEAIMPEDEIEYLIAECEVQAEILENVYDNDALVQEIQKHDNFAKWFDTEDLVSAVDVKDLVTFQNANVVARDLALSDPDVATALLDELLYWRETAERI